jgi:ElaB/YqjD/DUF883 family membrane-anchored ribosome-binding protein
VAESSTENASRIIDQAVDQIEGIAEHAKRALRGASSAARRLRGSIDDDDTTWSVAQRARSQAGEIAGTLYSRGQRAADVLGHQVGEQPVLALVVAGAIGFIVGFMLRSSGR